MEIMEGQGERQGEEYSQEQEYLLEQDAQWSNAGLLEFIDRCLDKGVVIEARSSVRLLGVEVVMLDFSSFVASLDTYLRYAAAIEQTALISPPQPQALIQHSADRQVTSRP